jgi:hypothetical protein
MNIALQMLAQVRGILSASGDGGVATLNLNSSLSKSVANGTGLNQANALYIDDFSIAASGTLNIDLTSLTDRFGAALSFSKVKEILLITDATNINDVVYGNGTNPFVGPLSVGTATVTVKPGNAFHVSNYSAAGWTVTDTTADTIKLANSGSGTAVTGTIVIVGLG